MDMFFVTWEVIEDKKKNMKVKNKFPISFSKKPQFFLLSHSQKFLIAQSINLF